MKYNYTYIYNNLIKLTRNKKLYVKLGKQDTFSDRLIIFFFHFAIFLKYYKSSIPSNKLQELFDFVIKQIEISIREVGYGDVSVNKKMKDFINIFYSLLEKIELLDLSKKERELQIYRNYLNIDKNLDFYADYFNKYRLFLAKNTLNHFTKDIINLNF